MIEKIEKLKNNIFVFICMKLITAAVLLISNHRVPHMLAMNANLMSSAGLYGDRFDIYFDSHIKCGIRRR